MKSMKLLAGALLLSPAMVLAAEPPAEIRYDYVDLGVTFGEVDTTGNDVDFSGFDVNGSWGFHPNVALIGGVGFGEIDTAGDIETTEFSIGVMPHFPLTDKIDLVIPVAIEWAEYDAGAFDDDDTGYSIGVGIRALPTPKWEFGAGLQYVDIFSNDEVSVLGEARWHISSLFSLSLGGSIGDDTSGVRFGGRFTF